MSNQIVRANRRSQPARPLRTRPRRGAIILLVAFVMVVLFVGVAFSVDVAHMQLTKTQLRVSTDLANRAGSEALARTKNSNLAAQVAKQIALANPVANRPLVLKDSQLKFGQVGKDNFGEVRFSPGTQPFNALQVDGGLTSQVGGGPVPLFFAGMLGTKQFEPQLTSIVTTQGAPKRDIAAVIDITGSMNSHTPTGTRFTDLLVAYNSLVVALNQTDDEEKLGLATYSTSSKVELPLQSAYGPTIAALSAKHPSGATNINSGIQAGRIILNNNLLRRPDVEKVMVLMTDGLHNTGPSPIFAAQDAKTDKIRIITITFDSTAGIPLMRQVAEITGGKHFHAPTLTELRSIFQDIGLGTEGLQYVDP